MYYLDNLFARMRWYKVPQVAASILCVLFLHSCAAPAYIQVNSTADKLGLLRGEVTGDEFTHVVYESRRVNATDRLHVYIEGDGVAWRMRSLISRDPTPRNPLMLQLMARDASSTLYVGRPCYFGHAPDKECHPDYWTYSRFSEKVVRSMVSVIEKKSAGFKSVVLMGHSGGGALAMLIAGHLPNVDAVVTVAGNLDVEAWVKHHRYSPLSGSLNPAAMPRLPVSVRQLHLVGGRDEVIPTSLVDDWISRQINAKRWFYQDYDHSCCWHKEWQKVLVWIDSVRVKAV